MDIASVNQILELNIKTQRTLGTLKALYDSYGRLPEAHADLVKATSKRAPGLTGLQDFTNEALRLHALYQQLAAMDGAAAGGA